MGEEEENVINKINVNLARQKQVTHLGSEAIYDRV